MKNNTFTNKTSKEIKRRRTLTLNLSNMVNIPFLMASRNNLQVKALQGISSIHQQQLEMKTSFTYDKKEPLHFSLSL